MTITQINQTHYNAYQSYMLLDFEFSFQKEYQKQKNDPGYQDMAFEERLTLMVDK